MTQVDGYVTTTREQLFPPVNRGIREAEALVNKNADVFWAWYGAWVAGRRDRTIGRRLLRALGRALPKVEPLTIEEGKAHYAEENSGMGSGWYWKVSEAARAADVPSMGEGTGRLYVLQRLRCLAERLAEGQVVLISTDDVAAARLDFNKPGPVILTESKP